PLYPFFSLGIAAYLSQRWVSKKYDFQFFSTSLLIGSLATLGGGIYLFIEEGKIILLMTAIAIFITLLLTALKIRQKSPKSVTILVVGLYISLGLFLNSNSWIWELNEAFPVKPVAALIRNNTPLNNIIYTDFSYSRPSLDFYSDRQVLAESKENLQKLAASSSYLLLDKHNFQQFKLSNAKILGEVQNFILILTSDNQN
ncbi:MAG: phospholipid carrier-dependent glycosyltransferase, partial [Cyanobacteria bacterium P01_G01_bin.49]